MDDDGLLEDAEAFDVDDRSTDAATPSQDPDGNRLAGDLAASSPGNETEGDGEKSPPSPAAFAGVHEHSPGHVRRLGDDDAAAMDALAERRAFPARPATTRRGSRPVRADATARQTMISLIRRSRSRRRTARAS